MIPSGGWGTLWGAGIKPAASPRVLPPLTFGLISLLIPMNIWLLVYFVHHPGLARA